MSELALNTVDYATRARIITMLVSGEYPTDMEIAVACNVTPAFIQRVLAEDKELSETRRQAEIEMAQKIERSAMQMAIDSRNPIAKQKAQEFMLKKLMPEKYGDNASNVSVGRAKKINISLTMPEVAVDENGIPIAQSVNPLQSVIESK